MSTVIGRGTALCAAAAFTVLSTSGIAAAAPSLPAPRINTAAPIPAGEIKRTADGRIDNPQLSITHPASARLSQGAVPNPWGCTGKTDYPHESGGQASTHARTVCNLVAPHVSVTSQMYRGRFYGAEAVGNPASSARDVSDTSQDAVTKWTCRGVGTYTYGTDSYHESTNGATTYIAYTGNSMRFPC
jgi:hypothetical protein